MTTVHQLRTRKTEIRKSGAKREDFFRVTIMISPELCAKARRLAILVIAVAGLTLTLEVAPSWGGPPNNDVSDANRNTAGGTNALLNTTGFDNTGFGAFALFNNTTGNSNTASGVDALHSHTTGNANTASGAFALRSNTTGSRNPAGGALALFSNSTGSNNIALGDRAGLLLTSGDNNIYLGNKGPSTESNTMRLGGTLQTQTFIAGIASTNVSGAIVLIDNSGQLGVSLSSARYKRDIHALGARSRGLLQLRPVTFRYRQDPEGLRQYGLLAEEVAGVYPELVTRGAQGQVEAVRYQELIPLLLNELQHQEQALGAQTRQLAELKTQNESLRAALVQQGAAQRAETAALAARLEQLEAAAPRAATLARR